MNFNEEFKRITEKGVLFGDNLLNKYIDYLGIGLLTALFANVLSSIKIFFSITSSSNITFLLLVLVFSFLVLVGLFLLNINKYFSLINFLNERKRYIFPKANLKFDFLFVISLYLYLMIILIILNLKKVFTSNFMLLSKHNLFLLFLLFIIAGLALVLPYFYVYYYVRIRGLFPEPS
jgi:hypothetical protein